MAEENIFYVYEHWRADKDQCFYVGKGHGWRSTTMRGRNAHHKNIQKKLARLGMCVEIRLIASGLTESEAFQIEMARIKHWMSLGLKLANRTGGGEGVSNPPDFVRKKVSDALKGNKHSMGVKRSEKECAAISERMKGNKFWEGREFTDEHRKNLSLALRGRPGRKKTEDEKAKIGAFFKGKKRSPEFCAKLSKAITESWERRRKLSDGTIGKTPPKSGLSRSEAIKKSWEARCRSQTPETKAKISAGLQLAYFEGRR